MGGGVRFRISIEGLNGLQYEKHCGVHIDFDNFVKNIEYLYRHKKNAYICVKIIDYMIKNVEDKNRFYQIFSSISDEIRIEYLMDVCSDIEYSKIGNITTDICQHGDQLTSEICPQPFYMLHIWPDGSVLPCCNYDNPYIIGNVRENPLNIIWNNGKHKHLMISQLESFKNIDQCNDCVIIKSAFRLEDKLDDYKEQIKRKLFSENN